MPRTPMSKEERLRKRREYNRRYYSSRRDELLAKANERTRTRTPQSAEQRRATKNNKELHELHSAVHPDLKPVIQTLKELQLAPKIYPSELRTMSELLMIISADWEFNGVPEETPSDENDVETTLS